LFRSIVTRPGIVDHVARQARKQHQTSHQQ
jgi:hypothetical protein